MDKNCINIGICFMPDSKTNFDVRCGAVNNSRHILATGTEQGVILIWNISSKLVDKIRYRGPIKRFKEIYEKKHGLKLTPSYMLVSNTNSVAFPVVQVEFAIGENINPSLSVNEDHSKDFRPVEFGEDILLSLHEDSTLCIWSLSSFRCLHKIRGPPFPIRTIKVLPDRRFLAIVGDVKINIIDIWSIRLIQTLEITTPQNIISDGSPVQPSSEENLDTSSTLLLNSAPRILTTACSIAPTLGNDSGKGSRNVCSLIFVAITTSNEMLLWDLTSSILSHKSDDQSFSGPVKVVTEWDSVYEVNLPIFLKNPRRLNPSRPKRFKIHKYPTLREYMYELEHEQGKICVLDNFVFLMVGYRILVWHYEAHELTRTAELLSFSDDHFCKSKAKWLGLKCVRAENSDLLCCWLRNGKMRIYAVPEVNSNRHFKVLANYKFPLFRHRPDEIDLYFKHVGIIDQGIPFYFIYFNRRVFYATHSLKAWKSQKNAVHFKTSQIPRFTCVVERSGSLNKIEFYENGDLMAVDINSFKRTRLPSPNLFIDALNKMTRSWRVRQFILTEAINDHLHIFSTNTGKSAQLLHCTGEYLVVALETSVLIYSLSSLSFKLLINAAHFFQIRSIHNVCSLSGSDKDLDLVELPHYFATVDSDGWMVLYNVHDVLNSCNSADFSDHVKIIIDDDCIYDNTTVKGQSDFDFLSDDFDISLSNFFIYRSSYRGIYRINTRYQLRDTNVDRVAYDKNRDLLFLLTSTSVMSWRVSTGYMVYSYSYLSLYRQAILVSSKADYKQLNSSLSISDAFSMILNTKNPTETPELRIPNYSSSLSLFSEKFKRKLKCNLFLSHLTLSMKANRYFKTQTHTKCTVTHTYKTDRNTFKFVNNKCIYKKRRFTHKTFGEDRSHVENTPTTSFNYSIPILVFTLEALLSRNGTDFLNLTKDCSFCYLGVPNGSLTIPLHYDLRESALKLIKRRSSIMGETAAMSLDYKFNKISHSYSLTEEPFRDLYDKHAHYHSDESVSSDNSESQLMSKNSMDDEFEDFETTHLHKDELFKLNKYLSTCVFFHKLFLMQNISNVYNGPFKPVKSSRTSIDSTDLIVPQCYCHFSQPLDLWLMVLIMMNTETEFSFKSALEYLHSYIGTLDKDELDLHVSRALTSIHVAQSFKLKGKANIAQIHICDCNSTVFTFGTKCGSCHKTVSKFDHSHEIKNLKNTNEDSSLIILALISLNNYLYSLKNSIRLGLKHYTISSYVVQQLMNKLLLLEDNTEMIKANQVQNKINTLKSENFKNFDSKSFFLELFALGFGVVWNLSTFSKQSILPDQIRYTTYSLLLREDFGSTEGICMDSAYFILYIFHYYHILRDKCWNKLMLISFSQNTPLAIDIMGWIVKKRKLGTKAIISALRLIIDFMENYTELAFTFLPDLVGIVIKCLDPLDYNIRILLLKPATNALFYLVKNIPMVDFHQDTQRFAVGSQSGYIIIYDIRTATKWRMFLGKQSQIACVAFGSNGTLISAYYNAIPCFIVWKVSSSGFIGSLLSSTSKEYKSVKLKHTNSLPTLNQMKNIKIQYKSTNKWFLHREDGRGYMIST